MANSEELLIEPSPWPTVEVSDPDVVSPSDEEVQLLPTSDQVDDGDDTDFDAGDEEPVVLPLVTAEKPDDRSDQTAEVDS